MRGEILNVEIARRLDEVADLLREQGANPFRIQAYRHAAEILRELRCSVAAIVHQARRGAQRQVDAAAGTTLALK